jgi:hypothetical protein
MKRKQISNYEVTNEIIRSKQDFLTRRQRLILKTLAKCNGIITHAMKLGRFNHCTHQKYMRENSKYSEAYNEIVESTVDMAEQSLLNQVVGENTAATIFYLKTKGKHRGYVERQEITHQVLIPKMIEIVKD